MPSSQRGPCAAATSTVTSTADTGPGTLRTALASAADGDTIDATGVSGTILLTTGELLVSKSVTILGPGPGTLAVDGNAASRVFHISPSREVTLTGLTITHGNVYVFPDNHGGGILNDHATLTVRNCTLSDNVASLGAGIFNRGLAADGGSATLTVVASTFSGNVAGDSGGGIYNLGYYGGTATLTVVDSTFSGNAAGDRGGGIYNNGEAAAPLTVVDSRFSGNSASYGGGIFNNGYDGGDATLTVVASTFSGNSASARRRHLQRFGLWRDRQQHTQRQLGQLRRRWRCQPRHVDAP